MVSSTLIRLAEEEDEDSNNIPRPTNLEVEDDNESAIISIAKTRDGKSIITQVTDDGGGLLSKRLIRDITLSINNNNNNNNATTTRKASSGNGASSSSSSSSSSRTSRKMKKFEKLLDQELASANILETKQLKLSPEAIYALATAPAKTATTKNGKITEDESVGLEIRNGKLVVVEDDDEGYDDDYEDEEDGYSDDEDSEEEEEDEDGDYYYYDSDDEEGEEGNGGKDEKDMDNNNDDDDMSLGSSVVTITTASLNGQRPPPKGIYDGGFWATQKYRGPNTLLGFLLACACCGFAGPLVLCFKCDEREVYIVNGKVYTAGGRCVGRYRSSSSSSSRRTKR